MPATSPNTGNAVATKLVAIGARLRAHRKALGVSATTAAEAAGMSRVTLHRIERGEPSVTMGAYMSALAAVGLDLELADAGEEKKAARRQQAPLKRIALASYPELKRIAWQLGDVTTVTAREALALYERNWRHIDKKAMDERERGLVRMLVETLGGARLLV